MRCLPNIASMVDRQSPGLPGAPDRMPSDPIAIAPMALVGVVVLFLAVAQR